MNNLLTTNDLASLLGIHPQTLADWRVDKRGPAWVRVGRTVRYSPDVVAAWLDAQTADVGK